MFHVYLVVFINTYHLAMVIHIVGSEKWLEAIIHGIPDFLTPRALSDVFTNYSLGDLMSWVPLAEC